MASFWDPNVRDIDCSKGSLSAVCAVLAADRGDGGGQTESADKEGGGEFHDDRLIGWGTRGDKSYC